MFTAMWVLIGIVVSFLGGLLAPGLGSLRDRLKDWPVTIIAGVLFVEFLIGAISFLWVLIGTPIQWAIDTFGN